MEDQTFEDYSHHGKLLGFIILWVENNPFLKLRNGKQGK